MKTRSLARAFQSDEEEHHSGSTETAFRSPAEEAFEPEEERDEEIGPEGAEEFLEASVTGAVPVRAKLEISDPGDDLEREADRVAEEVVGSTDEEPVDIQRKAISSAGSGEASPAAANAVNALRGGGMSLPESTRSFFEPRMGIDLSGVRVHNSPTAAEAASSINAQAFTFGRGIAFGEGKWAPDTPAGKKLLAHELAHVVQGADTKRVLAKAATTTPEQDLTTEIPEEEKATEASFEITEFIDSIAVEIADYIDRVKRKLSEYKKNTEFLEILLDAGGAAVRRLQIAIETDDLTDSFFSWLTKELRDASGDTGFKLLGYVWRVSSLVRASLTGDEESLLRRMTSEHKGHTQSIDKFFQFLPLAEIIASEEVEEVGFEFDLIQEIAMELGMDPWTVSNYVLAIKYGNNAKTFVQGMNMETYLKILNLYIQKSATRVAVSGTARAFGEATPVVLILAEAARWMVELGKANMFDDQIAYVTGYVRGWVFMIFENESAKTTVSKLPEEIDWENKGWNRAIAYMKAKAEERGVEYPQLTKIMLEETFGNANVFAQEMWTTLKHIYFSDQQRALLPTEFYQEYS